jgi:integrase/recombinase XerD
MPAESKFRVLDQFRDYLKIEKGLAPLSIAAYARDIRQFAEFLEKRKKGLLTAQRSHVREFLQQLFSHQVDGRSVGRKLSALRHLYRYLLLDKKIEHDPTLDIESPRQWKILPKALAKSEMEAMLAAPLLRQSVSSPRNSKVSSAIAARDRAMLEVFYAGALRVSEMVGAKLEDLKLEAGYMLVRGKGDKERVVPLGKSAQDALRIYLSESRPALASRKGGAGKKIVQVNSPLLFIARGGRNLTRQRVWQMVRAASAASGHSASPHMLRHSCATHRANHPWPRRYLHHAGLHAHRA